MNEELIERILFCTEDPTVILDRSSAGKDPGTVPAMTTLLIRVCDKDPKKFDEAIRLVKLFIIETLKQRDNQQIIE